ncbi:MAG: hypothetical protein CR217_07470 [Beijerinckiaceae bacterium]|nr:MAG: hypothetical protein CR217_07470 [Beijerinckiaceae bacterium]
MSIPHDHHFIPAFYLKQWAGADKKLTEFALRRGKLIVKRAGPRATGYETGLYAFPELPPDTAQHLENVYFNYADRLGSKALNAQLNPTGAPWPGELVSAWSRFVLGIYLRHPDAMPELRQGAIAEWDRSGEVWQAEYERIRKPFDPLTFDEYFANMDPLIRHKMQLNLVIKSLDNQFICQHINQMPFAVIDLSVSPVPLLTSDRPVEIFALGKPKGIISIPISPTKLFVAANDAESFKMIARYDAQTVVKHINDYVVTRARRFVWASDRSQEEYIKAKTSTAMEPLPLFPALSQRKGSLSNMGSRKL